MWLCVCYEFIISYVYKGPASIIPSFISLFFFNQIPHARTRAPGLEDDGREEEEEENLGRKREEVQLGPVVRGHEPRQTPDDESH